MGERIVLVVSRACGFKVWNGLESSVELMFGIKEFVNLGSELLCILRPETGRSLDNIPSLVNPKRGRKSGRKILIRRNLATAEQNSMSYVVFVEDLLYVLY